MGFEVNKDSVISKSIVDTFSGHPRIIMIHEANRLMSGVINNCFYYHSEYLGNHVFRICD
jgi:hypothetical protein